MTPRITPPPAVFLPPEGAGDDEDLKEVRCPSGPRRLFMNMRLAGERPVVLHPENWMEFSCYDCRRELERRGRHVKRVLHRYDLAGNFMGSRVVEE